MTKKTPTHEVENLTNSPYPMRTAAGYDRIVPAFTKIQDIPAASFLENVNKHFWKVTELVLSEEDAAARAAQIAEEKERADAEALMVKQAAEDAAKAAAEDTAKAAAEDTAKAAAEDAAKAAAEDTAKAAAEDAAKAAAEDKSKGEKK